MKEISIQRARKHHKCPYCNCEITTIRLGELWGKEAQNFVNTVKNESLKIKTLGVIFGDDRDPSYICENCNKEFDENMKEI